MKNDNQREMLSSLYDGELTDFEVRRLLNELHHDPSLLKQWKQVSRLHDALHVGTTGFESINLTQGIHRQLDRQLDRESTDLQLDTHKRDGVELPKQVMTGEESVDNKKQNGWKQVSVAASVMFFALVAMNGDWLFDSTGENSEFNTQIDGDQLAGQLAQANGLSYQTSKQDATQTLDTGTLTLKQQQQLQLAQEKLSEYLLQHAEHSVIHSAQGMLSQTKLASFIEEKAVENADSTDSDEDAND